MVFAESWCEIGTFWVSVAMCILCVVGACAGYIKWRNERKLERAKTLKEILAEFDKSKLCELVDKYDSGGGFSEWFSTMTDDDDRVISKSLRFLSYVCYLHEMSLITDDEFVLFESKIKDVVMDGDVQEYLTNTRIDSDDGVEKGQFAYLFSYAKSIGVYPFKNCSCRNSSGANEELIVTSPQGNVDKTIVHDIDEREFNEPTAIIKINQKYRDGMSDTEIYEATHGWWRVNKNVVEQIKVVLSVVYGEVKAVYRVSGWHYQSGITSGRMAFDGKVDDTLSKKFVDRSVRKLFQKGAANPIRYFQINH